MISAQIISAADISAITQDNHSYDLIADKQALHPIIEDIIALKIFIFYI